MNEKQFSMRLAQLRAKLNISARDMSLSLGQNPGYINAIENGKAFPTMSSFFYICEFLNVTPCEFFNIENDALEKAQNLYDQINRLDEHQIDILTELVRELQKKQ
ncbi:MAG: helix-turn-helix transcriptional regulator [Clostridiales bacterium]|nr:helix-turn-helix transcriptional regulator [Clostridiales bacterium]